MAVLLLLEEGLRLGDFEGIPVLDWQVQIFFLSLFLLLFLFS